MRGEDDVKAEQRLEATNQGRMRLTGKEDKEGFSPRGPANIWNLDFWPEL